MNLVSLSKEISYALRHNPSAYGLKLDDEGWADLTVLLEGLRQNKMFSMVTKSDIEEIIKSSERQRFEIKCGKIRAFYGHSINEMIKKESQTPPVYLYHGTTKNAYKNIMKTGIKRMQRQYVHLAVDVDTAYKVAKRYTQNPIILKIDTESAIKQGVKFYIGNKNIWLATTVPYKNICQKVDY